MTPSIATETGKVAPYTETCLCARALGACTWLLTAEFTPCVRASCVRRLGGAPARHLRTRPRHLWPRHLWINSSLGRLIRICPSQHNTGIVNELYLGTEQMRGHQLLGGILATQHNIVHSVGSSVGTARNPLDYIFGILWNLLLKTIVKSLLGLPRSQNTYGASLRHSLNIWCPIVSCLLNRLQ